MVKNKIFNTFGVFTETETMRNLLLLLALAMGLPALGQRQKGKSAEPVPVVVSEGLHYYLPRTGIRITVRATLTATLPGPYAAYADPFLGIKGVKTETSGHWEMKEVALATFSEPDPDRQYETSGLQASLLQLTPEGCLAGINSGAPVAEPRPVVTNSMLVKDEVRGMLFTNLTGNPNQTGRTPVDQRDSEAAVKILKARAARYDIAAGYLDEFHPDGKAYEESMEELRRIEKENLALFTGKTASEEYTFTFDFLPPAAPVKGEVVFRFDESRGVLPASDFSGIPVMINLDRVGPAPPAAAGESPAGIYYRQPATAVVTLVRELDEIATARCILAQFGTVRPLPAELINSHAVEFHPETGAIKTIRPR